MVRVVADIEDTVLSVFVIDDGEGVRANSVGGLGAGLSLIAESCDSFAVKERVPYGTEVRMTFRLG